MAQSGYTPILIYGSGTATNVPLAANLTSSASGTELALNYADGKLFYKDSGGVVQVLATKGAAQNSISFGTTGLTPNTATQGAVTVAGTLITSNGGTGLSSYTAGDLPYYASGTALSKLGIGTNGQILTSTGTAPQWTTLSGVAVTTFSAGTTGLTPSSATSGAITLAGTLNVANGGTGLNSLTAGYIPYGNGTSAFSSSSNLYFNGSYLGIGTSSPSYPLTVNGTTFTTGITISTGGGTNSANTVNIDTDGAGTARYYSHGGNTTTVGSHSWHLVSSNGSVDTTAMSLNYSGNLLVGTTDNNANGRGAATRAVIASPSSGGGDTLGLLQVSNSAFNISSLVNTTSGTRYHIGFSDGTTWVERGTISTNGTGTSYNTTSDYRLKENVAPMSGALAKVATLKPVTYTWKETGTNGEGFIAHELAEICRDAVVGEKDGVKEDGTPQYQQIDTSFLVATLTCAIQEQQALIESLTTRLTALENK